MVGVRHKGDRVTLLQAQLTSRGVDLEVVLTGEGADLLLRLFADQGAVVQCSRNSGLRDPGQSGDVSDRADSFRAHLCNRLHCTTSKSACQEAIPGFS